jgi:hypothetical protein
VSVHAPAHVVLEDGEVDRQPRWQALQDRGQARSMALARGGQLQPSHDTAA